MRFVGKPNGKLLRGAPGNYIHGQVYQMSFNNSKFKFWELVEEEPVLTVPEDTESIYEEPIYVPAEGLDMGNTPVEHPEDVNVDPTTDATIEPYMSFNATTGEMSPYVDTSSEEVAVTETVSKKLTRDELKELLDEAGVVYKPGARTTTLERLVDELVSKE